MKLIILYNWSVKCYIACTYFSWTFLFEEFIVNSYYMYSYFKYVWTFLIVTQLRNVVIGWLILSRLSAAARSSLKDLNAKRVADRLHFVTTANKTYLYISWSTLSSGIFLACNRSLTKMHAVWGIIKFNLTHAPPYQGKIYTPRTPPSILPKIRRILSARSTRYILHIFSYIFPVIVNQKMNFISIIFGIPFF